MNNYLRFALSILILVSFTSCKQSQSTPYSTDNSRVIFHVFIRNEPSPEIFNNLVDICKEYGTVKVIDAESIKEKDMGLLLFLSASQIYEGYLSDNSLPEFGKSLPVYKAELLIPQSCDSPQGFTFHKEEYLEITADPKENNQKLIKAFKHLLSDFDFFYRKHKISPSNPNFWIIKD